MMLIIFQQILLKSLQLLEALLMPCIVPFNSDFELISHDISEGLEGLFAKPEWIAFTISSIFEYFRMSDML